jgi:5,10-methylenetetrahydromethanopterin reductase
MTRFGISIGVSPREPLSHAAEIAEEADRRGFAAVWVVDFQMGMKDAYAAMNLIALRTKQIEIGPGVTNLQTRHSTVTANAITALDEISNGRAMLGIGAGWSAVLAAGKTPSKLGEIRKDVGDIRRLFSGEEFMLDGNPAQLATARRQIPIYLASSQPGMLRLAGEVADGVILMGAADPEFCRWQLNYIYEGLEKAGRSRSDLLIDFFVTVSVADNEAKALDDVRAWATAESATFATWKTMPESYMRFREEFEAAANGYHLVDHLSLNAAHTYKASDKLANTLAIAGDEKAVVDRLRDLAAVDVDRISIALLSGGRMKRLAALADSVIPKVTAA